MAGWSNAGCARVERQQVGESQVVRRAASGWMRSRERSNCGWGMAHSSANNHGSHRPASA